jgi:hypothetical protein
LSALVGQSIEETGLGESLSGSNSGSIFDSYEYAYLSNVKTITQGSTLLSGSPIGQWAISSFFGRINYDYKEKYLFTALLRRDGSSNFARGYRWGNFPSVSAGWILTNENFLQSSKSWLDYLKLGAKWKSSHSSLPVPFAFYLERGKLLLWNQRVNSYHWCISTDSFQRKHYMGNIRTARFGYRFEIL